MNESSTSAIPVSFYLVAAAAILWNLFGMLAYLGQVTMKVRQTGGELQVDMRVDNMMAKQIIEAGFDTLKSRFLDQELAYDQLSLNIEVDQRSASQYDRDQQNSGFGEENASRSRGDAEQETIPDPMNSRPIVNNDSALNIYV